jgi:hypothetical protein
MATKDKEITVKIRGNAVSQLENLKAADNTHTSAEIVRNALKTYKALQSFKDPQDESIIIERPDGTRVKLILP